jgi:ParB family chromosome partitioning protein
MADTATLGTIEHIDPAKIEVETNIRTNVKLDPGFVASIGEYGVLSPVGCRRTEDGTVTVRIGQRRVLAAREVGLATVPAYIVEGDDSTVERLLEQFVENEQRAALTEPERAVFFQQLAFEGLTVPQIAKRTSVPRKVVEAGIKVAESEFAQKVAAKHEVTLDQAAAIMEFEGDKDAVNRLVQYAEEAPEQFAHEVQRQRDERVRRDEVVAEQANLTEQGYTILHEPPYYDDKDTARLTDLTTKDGADLTDEHLVGIGKDRQAYVVWGWNGLTTTVYVRNFRTYGFKKRTNTAAGPMTDEQKAERKSLIANNKAWDSAEVVRREWLTAFLTRKTLPKDAGQFVAVALTVHRATVAAGLGKGNRLAATLLSLDAQESEWGASPIDPIAESSPARAGHVAVAVVLGAFEGGIGRHTWRNPGRDAVAYFEQIAAWGYPLSEVEHIVLGTTPDQSESAADDHEDEPSTPDEGDDPAA